MKTLLILFLAIFIRTLSFAQIIDTTVYIVPDTMPRFEYKKGKDNKESLILFTSDNMLWPSQDNCVGTVYINSIVEKTGKLSNIHIVRGLESCSGFNEEALRIVNIMQGWSPGYKNGEIVRTQIIIPIRFQLY
ncbi:MAG: TonB family protein [bacterium]|nr:TonB family protein [bacterium]